MRPIDADTLMETIRENEYPLTSHLNSRDNGMFTIGIQQAVDEQPTLDYKDLVPQGEWIDCRGGDATCSRCGIRQKAVYDDNNEQHFCGHCGARMTK